MNCSMGGSLPGYPGIPGALPQAVLPQFPPEPWPVCRTGSDAEGHLACVRLRSGRRSSVLTSQGSPPPPCYAAVGGLPDARCTAAAHSAASKRRLFGGGNQPALSSISWCDCRLRGPCGEAGRDFRTPWHDSSHLRGTVQGRHIILLLSGRSLRSMYAICSAPYSVLRSVGNRSRPPLSPLFPSDDTAPFSVHIHDRKPGPQELAPTLPGPTCDATHHVRTPCSFRTGQSMQLQASGVGSLPEDVQGGSQRMGRCCSGSLWKGGKRGKKKFRPLSTCGSKRGTRRSSDDGDWVTHKKNWVVRDV